MISCVGLASLQNAPVLTLPHNDCMLQDSCTHAFLTRFNEYLPLFDHLPCHHTNG